MHTHKAHPFPLPSDQTVPLPPLSSLPCTAPKSCSCTTHHLASALAPSARGRTSRPCPHCQPSRNNQCIHCTTQYPARGSSPSPHPPAPARPPRAPHGPTPSPES
uniref:Uncharacterized protein n=1 Tax=Arundo donax TaxID=35708 RepID=A0A0A9ENM5_ARUDO